MNSPKQQPVSDEEARRLANGLVRLFRSPLKIVGTLEFEKPLTIADAIRMGGLILAAMNKATGRDWLKEQNREFLVKMATMIYVPDEMEEFLYTRIKERSENAGDINVAILQVEEQMSGPGAVRLFIKKALAEVMPKPRLGRPTGFNPSSDPSRFLELSTELYPACGKFLALKEDFPRKNHKELIEFLQSEHPKAAELMRKRESYISQTMNDVDFRILKGAETMTRWLADAVAGKELFDWSFTYAIQRAGEFRRSKGIESEE